MQDDHNPKTRLGRLKLPMHLVPPSATMYLAMALEDGGNKYGPYNWREEDISISTYYSAMKRHMDAFWDGEDLAPDSGVHHVAHAMACCALILDAHTIDRLIDDRPPKGAAAYILAHYIQARERTE